jgi:transmembrane sensor
LGPELAREIRTVVRRRRRRRLATGAAVACAGVFGLLLWSPSLVSPPTAASSAPTPREAVVSLPARRHLSDGSTVELRPGAEISVDFSPTARRIVLLRGVAHFHVAKTAARPFVVAANGVDVRAVGTAFSVELAETAVEVVVTEGTVALDQTGARSPGGEAPASGAVPAATPQQVMAGQHVTIPLAATAAPSVRAISTEEMGQRMAWRVPRLEFSGTPLAEVVMLFRRHGGVNLTIGDASLEQVRVSGILRATNSAALFELLAADHGIVPEHRGEQTVLVRR